MKTKEDINDFANRIKKSSFTTAIEIRDKQVIVYVSDVSVTLLHIPSGKSKAIFVPIDDFIKRVSEDATTDSGDDSVTESSVSEQ